MMRGKKRTRDEIRSTVKFYKIVGIIYPKAIPSLGLVGASERGGNVGSDDVLGQPVEATHDAGNGAVQLDSGEVEDVHALRFVILRADEYESSRCVRRLERNIKLKSNHIKHIQPYWVYECEVKSEENAFRGRVSTEYSTVRIVNMHYCPPKIDDNLTVTHVIKHELKVPPDQLVDFQRALHNVTMRSGGRGQVKTIDSTGVKQVAKQMGILDRVENSVWYMHHALHEAVREMRSEDMLATEGDGRLMRIDHQRSIQELTMPLLEDAFEIIMNRPQMVAMHSIRDRMCLMPMSFGQYYELLKIYSEDESINLGDFSWCLQVYAVSWAAQLAYGETNSTHLTCRSIMHRMNRWSADNARLYPQIADAFNGINTERIMQIFEYLAAHGEFVIVRASDDCSVVQPHAYDPRAVSTRRIIVGDHPWASLESFTTYCDRENDTAGVSTNDCVYLTPMWKLLDCIARVLSGTHASVASGSWRDYPELSSADRRALGASLTEEQQAVVDSVCNASTGASTFLTGEAGTGKTQTCKTIIHRANQLERQTIYLLSRTGAIVNTLRHMYSGLYNQRKRTDRRPVLKGAAENFMYIETIHMAYTLWKNGQIRAPTLIIVEEFENCNVEMCRMVFQLWNTATSVNPCRLLFVGDDAQVQPFSGHGAPFSRIVSECSPCSQYLQCFRLTRNFRVDADSIALQENARLVRAQTEGLSEKLKIDYGSPFQIHDLASFDDIARWIISSYDASRYWEHMILAFSSASQNEISARVSQKLRVKRVEACPEFKGRPMHSIPGKNELNIGTEIVFMRNYPEREFQICERGQPRTRVKCERVARNERGYILSCEQRACKAVGPDGSISSSTRERSEYFLTYRSHGAHSCEKTIVVGNTHVSGFHIRESSVASVYSSAGNEASTVYTIYSGLKDVLCFSNDQQYVGITRGRTKQHVLAMCANVGADELDRVLRNRQNGKFKKDLVPHATVQHGMPLQLTGAIQMELISQAMPIAFECRLTRMVAQYSQAIQGE